MFLHFRYARATQNSRLIYKIKYLLMVVWLTEHYLIAHPLIYPERISKNDTGLHLNYFSSTEAENVSKIKINEKNTEKIMTENLIDDTSHFDSLILIKSSSPNENPKSIQRNLNLAKIENEITYDYDQFKNEYDSIMEQTEKAEGKLNETEFKPPIKSQCDADKFFNKGPFTVACLVIEYFNTKETTIKENAGTSLIRLLRLWLLAALLFFLIGWAHYGYLNVCCPFSVCFPDDEYDEIKRQLVLNPPGTRTETKPAAPDGRAAMKLLRRNYKSSEPEYYFFNMLWNKIYRN